MSRLALIAQAIDAEREADTITAAMRAARQAAGSQALVPTGWHERAQRASDLRRRARWLRAQAADPAISSGASAAPASPALSRAPARSVPKPVDPVEALVAQIVASAKAAGL